VREWLAFYCKANIASTQGLPINFVIRLTNGRQKISQVKARTWLFLLRGFGCPILRAGLLLVLGKILMPLTSWLSGAWVPMWLRSRLAGISRVRSARLIGLARLASVGVFGIASPGPKGHREILQFFSNQTQFVDDRLSYLVFHIAPLRILRPSSTNCCPHPKAVHRCIKQH
jgi:hypothetical protein